MDGGKGTKKRSACGRDDDEIPLEPRKKPGKSFLIAYVNNISGSSVAARPPLRSAVGLQKFEIVNELESADHVDDEHGSFHEWKQVPGNTSVDNSSDGDSLMCPVCFNILTTQKIGTPDTCDHTFCVTCLEKWTKIKNTCPVDRKKFKFIIARNHLRGNIRKKIPVEVRRRVGCPVLRYNDTVATVGAIVSFFVLLSLSIIHLYV
jgi:hypothetical protein